MNKFKSKEEEAFAEWCIEAGKYGLIEGWQYEPEPYILTPRQTVNVRKRLKTKFKTVERSVFKKHRYMPDYKIVLSELGLVAFKDVFAKTYLAGARSELFSSFKTAVIDTKGGFMNRGAGQEFSINQKLMYHFYGIIVEKVNPWRSQRDRKGLPKKTNPDGSLKIARCFFMDTFCPRSLRVLQNGKVSAMGLDCPTVEEFINKIRGTK
jgi:hypothetical protein